MQSEQNVTVIGDVHGCLPSLSQLLEKIPEDSPLIFIGDLINRGPASLETLRLVHSMGKRATLILGNHEMHLLATAAGAGKPNRRDTIDEILAAPDAEELIDWIRHQYLLYDWKDYTFVHAAIDPAWSEMYGKDLWDNDLTGPARMRAILNGFTRIRFVDKKGIPDYKAKDSPGNTPKHLMPWFEYSHRKTKDDNIVFGHWSTLGLVIQEHLIALDTGCVWGGALTAVMLPQRQVIQVKAPQYCNPFA